MPVGLPLYFKGDPYKIRTNPFGFFHVDVISPDRKAPFLPYRLKKTTTYPIGNWSG